MINLDAPKVCERTPASLTEAVAQEELVTDSIRHLFFPTRTLLPFKLSIAPTKETYRCRTLETSPEGAKFQRTVIPLQDISKEVELSRAHKEECTKLTKN